METKNIAIVIGGLIGAFAGFKIKPHKNSNPLLGAAALGALGMFIGSRIGEKLEKNKAKNK